MFRKKILPAILPVLIFCGCKKANEYPIEPVISFKSLTAERNSQGYNEGVTLVISFTDGDGDVGLDETYNYPPFNSSSSPYYNNFFVTCFLKINNVWTEYVFPTALNFHGRIEPLTPEGRNKSIRGDISYDIEFLPLNQPNRPMRFEVYMYDRALHRSNTVTTPEIIINTN